MARATARIWIPTTMKNRRPVLWNLRIARTTEDPREQDPGVQALLSGFPQELGVVVMGPPYLHFFVAERQVPVVSAENRIEGLPVSKAHTEGTFLGHGQGIEE